MKMVKDEISIPRQIDLNLFLPLLVPKEKEKTVPLNATHSIQPHTVQYTSHTVYNHTQYTVGEDK